MVAILSRGDKLDDGHYTVVKEIGVGGMGVVYHCRDEMLLRDVAIKMLLPELMKDKANFEAFKQEARLAAQLEHPNIVTIYDIGVERRKKNSHHYVVMECLTGGNLAGAIAEGAIPMEHCLNWMKQLAQGMSFAHKRGVIHQDIKAENIFITNEGDLKIGDFGLARLIAGRMKQLNAHQRGMGTPAYMSPELCWGDPQDHRSDIYSLGVLFFEMATGVLPYHASEMIGMAMKHTSAAIPSARRLNPLVPEMLDKVIHRMMAKSPEERYQNASDVLTILDDLIFELRVQRLGLTQARPLMRSGPVHQQPSISVASTRSAASDGASSLVKARQTEDPISVARTGRVPKDKSNASFISMKAQELLHSAGKSNSSPASGGRTLEKPREHESKLPLSHPSARVSAKPQPASDSATKSKEDSLPGKRARQESAPAAPVREIRTAQAPFGLAQQPRWSFSSNGPIGWTSSPVLERDEKVVYVSSTDGCVYAIDVLNGKQIWSYKTGGPILASPVLSGGRLVVVDIAGQIQALSTKEGKPCWKVALGKKLVATPAVYKDNILVPTINGKLMAMDIRDGRAKWQYKTNGAIVSTPVLHAESALFGTRSGIFHSVSAERGKSIWSYEVDDAIVAGPATSADSVYFGTQAGTFYALDADTGRLVWEYPANGAVLSKGVVSFTSVVFVSQDGWIYCCEKYDGRLMWKAATKGGAYANLVAVRGTVICASRKGWLSAYNSRTGEVIWQRNLGHHFESAPLITGDMLYIGTVEGDLIAYPLETAFIPEKKSA